MEREIKKARAGHIVGMCLMLAAVVISGCTTQNIISGNEAPVLFECIPSEGVYITEARVLQDADTATVIGRVKRSAQNCCDATRGHVDIVVVGPDGLIQDVVSASYSPRNIPKVRTRSSRFEAMLGHAVSDGSTIRVTYHDSAHAGDVTAYTGAIFECENNMALPDGQG